MTDTTVPPPPTPQKTNYKLLRKIERWAWKENNDPTRTRGVSVQDAADHFKVEPAMVRDLVGTPLLQNCGPYFYWEGTEDPEDFANMILEHDGE